MAIVIKNVSAQPAITGANDYVLRINSTVIANFKHNREDSLAVCLRRAADAAEIARAAEIALIIDGWEA